MIATETSRRANILARRNYRTLGLNVAAYLQNDSLAAATHRAIDAVLLDPPRSGARNAIEKIAGSGPKRVVYVSCDSATLARDAKILSDAGYNIVSLSLFDMFPQTPHIEILAVFDRS